jgi:hypothetical protein
MFHKPLWALWHFHGSICKNTKGFRSLMMFAAPWRSAYKFLKVQDKTHIPTNPAQGNICLKYEQKIASNLPQNRWHSFASFCFHVSVSSYWSLLLGYFSELQSFLYLLFCWALKSNYVLFRSSSIFSHLNMKGQCLKYLKELDSLTFNR